MQTDFIYDCTPDFVHFDYKFTGKERDTESGLDYFGARYYASSMGRWMSPDWSKTPAGVPYADLSNPQSLNLYEYVGNNPLSRPDLDGHGCPPDCDPGTSTMSPYNGGSMNPANSSGLNMLKDEFGGLAHTDGGKIVALGETSDISATANAGFVQINSTGATTLQAVPGVGATVEVTMHAPGATPDPVSVSAGTPVVSGSVTATAQLSA